MDKFDDFTKWAIKLQSIAQNGLTYAKDKFDIERYQEVRKIAAEMMAKRTGLPPEKINTLFCGDEGYQTPKIDTRAAIFKDNKILLVHEKMSNDWSLPGGWCDNDISAKENCIKEAYEEAGLKVKPVKLIAFIDRNKHTRPVLATKIMKAFYLCESEGGKFEQNIETDDCKYFALDRLPNLSMGRNTPEQIKMCFDARCDNWQTLFD